MDQIFSEYLDANGWKNSTLWVIHPVWINIEFEAKNYTKNRFSVGQRDILFNLLVSKTPNFPEILDQFDG